LKNGDITGEANGMKANGILALLTDFGTSDWYVGSIKAAALAVYPEITLVDISHEINQGSIAEGAFVLARCFDDFPEGTTFVVVVDPGVGTKREAVAVSAGGYYFVGPNNGVLFPVISQFPNFEAVRIENPGWRGKKSSATFHGRDLFAPAGGRLAKGDDLEGAGSPLENLVSFSFPVPAKLNGFEQGCILYFDRFGNALTNFQFGYLETVDLIGLRVADIIYPLAKTFGVVEEGDPVSYWGSSGFLELAIRNGNAQVEYGLNRESLVEPVYRS
jgi:S-adenosyl-L-methionine hydrolase (adenosine-forming)